MTLSTDPSHAATCDQALAAASQPRPNWPDAGTLAPRDFSQPLLALQASLAKAGWEIDHLDVDLTGSTPRLDFKVSGADGKWLFARVDQIGRCTVERYVRVRRLAMDDLIKGRKPLSVRLDDHFMGRHRPPTAGHLLDYVGDYIADNAIGPVCRLEMRGAWQAIAPSPTDAGA